MGFVGAMAGILNKHCWKGYEPYVVCLGGWKDSCKVNARDEREACQQLSSQRREGVRSGFRF